MDDLQPRHLLVLDYSEVVAHFKGLLLSTAPVDQINSRLRQLIHDEALPPTLYYPWLCLALQNSPQLLSEAIRDPVSYGIRAAAIHAASGIFHSKEWKSKGWDVLGGAEGIKAIIIENLSLNEVKRLSKAIVRCRYMADREAIAVCIEDLLNRLRSHDSGSSHSIFLAVARLYPLCGEAFVTDLLTNFPDTSSTTAWLLSHLVPLHVDLLRRIAVGSVSAPRNIRWAILNTCGRELIGSTAPYMSVRYKHLSEVITLPGVLFYLDLCGGFTEWSIEFYQHDSYVKDALRLAERAHVPFQSILQLFQHLTTMAPKIWKTGILDTSLALELIRCWSVARFRSGGPDSIKEGAVMKRLTHPDHPSHPSSEHQNALESTLVELLQRNQDPKLDPVKHWNGFVETITKILKRIAPTARLPFLELLCRHSDYLFKEPGYDFTFHVKENPPREKERQILSRWDSSILRLLPETDSQMVFDRMLVIHGRKDFVPVESGQDDQYLSFEQQCRLKAHWEAQGTEDFPVTRKLFLRLKQAAEKQRDAEQRLKSAVSAVCVAIDSTSLDLFHDMLQWTKRFLRDATVFPELMEYSILENETTAAVLSCNPPESRRPKNMSELQASVDKVNEILRTLLEVSILSLREPISYDALDWNLYTLFKRLIEGRLEAIKVYRKAGLGTESEMGEILLMSLVPVMVEYERVALKDEDADWNHLVMQLDYSNITSLTAIAFLDRLAEKYDLVYQEYRSKKEPRVLDLPEGWPRGASISDIIQNSDLGGLALKHPDIAPFMSNRLRQVVFHRVEVVTAPVPEAIGEFISFENVDNMDSAVDSYLRSHPPKKRNDALVSLWRHYEASADQYGEYLPMLQSFLMRNAENNELYKAQNIIGSLHLPQATYLAQVQKDGGVEWNPAPAPARAPKTNESKELPNPLLHAMIWNYIRPGIFEQEDQTDSTVPLWGWAPAYKWRKEANSDLFRGLSTSTREAMILSVLLYLDTHTPTSTQTGSTPFPNSDSPRYPGGIHLSDEYLSEVSNPPYYGPQHAAIVLRAYNNAVPARILRDLAMGFLDKIATVPRTDSDYMQLFTPTVQLLRFIVLSDSPELAVDVILRVIEHYPNDSAYHRELKLLALGRRLSPDAAKSYLERFAGFVCERLDEQKKNKNDSASSDKEDQQQPKRFVKVTTVKMLAQVVAGADFVPTSTCLDILNRVFHATHHIDMRVEVVKATMSIFNRVSGTDTEDIFRFFASLTSAAAGASETEPVTDEKLPNVSLPKDRPLLDLFVKDAVSTLPVRYRVTYVQHVLLPLIDESTKQHNRWMDVFLGGLGLSRENPSVNIEDFGPFAPSIVDTILHLWSGYLPAEFLARHRVWALPAHVNRGAFENISQALLKAGETDDGTGKQHWHAYLAQIRQVDPFLRLAYVLSSDINTQLDDGGDGLTTAKVTEEYAYRAKVIARNPVAFNSSLRKFTVSLDPLMKGLRDLRRRTWPLSNAKDKKDKFSVLNKTLEDIVEDIKSLRSDAWVKDPQRKPVILPSTFELDIQLLPSSTKSNKPLEEYVHAVLNLLRKCVHDPMCLLLFTELEKDVLASVSEKDIIHVATLFANVDGDEQQELLETSLRVRLAKGLLLKLTDAERKLSADVQGMVSRWRDSASEVVRGVGWGVE